MVCDKDCDGCDCGIMGEGDRKEDNDCCCVEDAGNAGTAELDIDVALETAELDTTELFPEAPDKEPEEGREDDLDGGRLIFPDWTEVVLVEFRVLEEWLGPVVCPKDKLLREEDDDPPTLLTEDWALFFCALAAAAAAAVKLGLDCAAFC